nr:GntR family transcriptional regulator [Streptomyces sp. SID12501]
MQVQIYRHLRSEILDGLWVGRTDFPTERDLATRFGVSVITSRAALERLASEGMLIRRRGVRTRAVHTVTEPGPQPPPLTSVSTGRGRAGRMKIRLLEAGVGIAPAAACRTFGLSPGSHLWQCVRLRTLDGRPDIVTQNVQPTEVGLRHTRRMLENKPMAQIFQAEEVEIATMHRRFTVGLPPPLVARHLRISIDQTVLVTFLIAYARSGEVVEWLRAYSHPDRIEPEEVLDLTTDSWQISLE